MYIVTDYHKSSQYIYFEDRSYTCPTCRTGQLAFRDYCRRIVRYEDGSSEWVWIPRHKCTNKSCGRLHRMLPSFLIPFKHYAEDIIEEALSDDLAVEDYYMEAPSDMTIVRWRYWKKLNKEKTDNFMHSLLHEKEGCTNAPAMTGGTGPDSWLSQIIRHIYNSGDKLTCYR